MGGFVYVMSNPSFPNLVKIGKSERDPSVYRRAELETTGVPTPFKVEYYAFVEDHNIVERKAHEALLKFRNSSNREFFSCPIPKAIYEIRRSSGSQLKFEEISYVSHEDLAIHEKDERERLAKAQRELEIKGTQAMYEREIHPYLTKLSKALKKMYHRSMTFVLNDPYDGTLLGYLKGATEGINFVTFVDEHFLSKKYESAMRDFPKYEKWSVEKVREYRLALTPQNRNQWDSLHTAFVKAQENEIREMSYDLRKKHGIGRKLARLNW